MAGLGFDLNCVFNYGLTGFNNLYYKLRTVVGNLQHCHRGAN